MNHTESAWERFYSQSRPELDSLKINTAAVAKNQERIDNLVGTIARGNADAALFEILNRKASELRMEREKLLTEQRHLQEALVPLQSGLNAEIFRSQLISWTDIMQEARPEEKQRLIRLLVRKIEWQPEGNQAIEFFALPQLPQKSRQIKNEKTSPETNQDWFATSVRLGCPWGGRVEPLFLIIPVIENTVLQIGRTMFGGLAVE